MSWLTTFSFVMRSNITSIRERIADPERMLHQLLIDMDEELERVRTSVAAAIADEIQLEKKVVKATKDVDHWMTRAGAALKRNDDTSARAALEQKDLAAQRAETLATELAKQKEQTHSLQASVRDLEDKIRQARQKQTLLLARMSRAESANRINQAMERVGQDSAFAQFQKIEQRVEREEAMSEAYDRLDGRDPTAEELERKFEESERKDRLAGEFEALKKRVRDDE